MPFYRKSFNGRQAPVLLSASQSALQIEANFEQPAMET
jgi:hypothetical protein